jgi:hypothetical protein
VIEAVPSCRGLLRRPPSVPRRPVAVEISHDPSQHPGARLARQRSGAGARPVGHQGHLNAATLVLGFDAVPIAISAVLYFWHSIFLHANVRMSFGPLRCVIASPVFHHWHHAARPDAYGKNFAGQLSIPDSCSGQCTCPKGKRRSAMVWMSRFLIPTSRSCYTRSNGLGSCISAAEVAWRPCRIPLISGTARPLGETSL